MPGCPAPSPHRVETTETAPIHERPMITPPVLTCGTSRLLLPLPPKEKARLPGG
jgi:hypothetical protein